MDEQKLFQEGIEEAKISYVILENVIFIAMIVLGFLLMYPISFKGIPVLSILYALFIAAMLLLVLGKHVCTNCYYYGKWCHCGCGKLAKASFSKNSGNHEFGCKLAILTWIILMLLPIIVKIILIVIGKSSFKDQLYLFLPFLILSVISLILHKRDCKMCKMRFICPVSAAK